MEYDVWAAHYRRLCAAKEHAKSGEQCQVYFEALKGFPEPCVAAAVHRAMSLGGWPKTDVLVALAREERSKLTTPASSCEICHGEAWVRGPDRHDFGNTYETAMRCPRCWPHAKNGTAA